MPSPPTLDVWLAIAGSSGATAILNHLFGVVRDRSKRSLERERRELEREEAIRKDEERMIETIKKRNEYLEQRWSGMANEIDELRKKNTDLYAEIAALRRTKR